MPTDMGDFHHPHPLSDSNWTDEKYIKAIKYCEEGLPPRDATELAFGVLIPKWKWRRWTTWVIEDMEAGFDEEDSNLIKLMIALSKQDQMLHKTLSRLAIASAKSGNPNMQQYLLNTRFGYTEKTSTEIDLNIEDTPVVFNIVDMKPNEEEEE